jgi:hypothetical protein
MQSTRLHGRSELVSTKSVWRDFRSERTRRAAKAANRTEANIEAGVNVVRERHLLGGQH